MSAAFVRFDDVSLAYDGTGNAIEDINLSIREGEFVAFVGPSRTTLDNVLLPLEIVEPYRRQFRKRREEFVGWARSLLKTVGLAEHENKYPC